MDPLRGEYGFLTEFDNLSEEEARERVRSMVTNFRILEFQFYDAFQGYSQPPEPGLENWRCACFNRPVSRAILRVYVDEIRRLGGRSWLYVQAMGTDPGDAQAQNGFAVAGQHMVDGRPLLDVVAPTAAWALAIAPKWAAFASSVGFSGIHWDTLGDVHHVNASGSDMPGFLRAALPLLAKEGIAQTGNFVDGFGWDNSLLEGVGWSRHIIAFPYWEAWTMPEIEERFFDEVAPVGGGVFVCYPGKTAAHTGERQNVGTMGIWPLDLLILRWRKVHCRGSAYLAIGDGARHIQTEYFPDTMAISDADVTKVRGQVFGQACAETSWSCLPTACRSGHQGWLVWVGTLSAVLVALLIGRYSSALCSMGGPLPIRGGYEMGRMRS